MRRPFKHIDLDDKFSDFEHTPDDSNWDKISGGLNPKMAPGALSDKFSEFSEPVSKDVWNNISSDMHPNRKKRRAAIWWFSSGIAASFLGLFIGLNLSSIEGEFASSNYEPRSEFLSVFDSEDFTNANGDLDVEFINSLDNHGTKLSSTAQSSNSHLISNTHENSASYSNTALISNEILTPLNSDEDSTIIFKIEKPHVSTRLALLASDSDLKPLAGEEIFFWSGFRPKKNRELLAVNQLSERTNSSNWFATDGLSDDMSTPESFINQGTTESLNDYLGVNGNVAQLGFVSPEEFKTPINISLILESSLSRGRKERLDLGAGLGLLVVNSSVTTSNADFSSVEKISRSYITVPIYLKYNFIEKRRLDVYTSLGSSTEFGVNGSKSFESSSNAQFNSVRSKFALGFGQINVNAGLGTSVKLSNYINLFAEASISHYFYQSHYTIWSNQKYWPTVKTGITVNL